MRASLADGERDLYFFWRQRVASVALWLAAIRVLFTHLSVLVFRDSNYARGCFLDYVNSNGFDFRRALWYHRLHLCFPRSGTFGFDPSRFGNGPFAGSCSRRFGFHAVGFTAHGRFYFAHSLALFALRFRPLIPFSYLSILFG